MATTRESKRGHAIGGGVMAGVVGGVALALVMLVAAIAKGQDIWPGFKMASAPFLGERAMQPGFDLGAVLAGTASHFAVSIVWGVLFAILFYGLSKPATLAVGALWGIGVWLAMFYVVLPIAGLGEMAASAPIGMAILEHVIFGLAVAIGFLPFQRTKHVIPIRRAPAPS